MAITNSHVYTTIIDFIRADKRGLSLSIDEYNRLSRIVNERLYAKFYYDFEISTNNSGILGGFKSLNYPIPLVAGVGSLPSDYYNLIGKPYYVDGGGVMRYIDLVSSMELAERMTDYLTQPSVTHPTCILGGLDGSDNLQITVNPTSIVSIYIDYLRTADMPFLDYYVNDTTLEETYLTAGAIGVTVPLGYKYRTGLAGVQVLNSVTVDWEWSSTELSLILSIFCQLIGITLPDQLLIETGVINEAKE